MKEAGMEFFGSDGMDAVAKRFEGGKLRRGLGSL